jgi:hypothetical protein
MKTIAVVAVAGLCAIHTWAQVALVPDSPAISPSPVFVPGSAAITPGSINPNPVVATNATLVALSDALAALQNNLLQTLPLLTVFNDNFDFVSLGDNGAAARAATGTANFGSNLATNFAANFGVNASVPTGGSLFNTSPVVNRPVPAAAGLPQGLPSVPVSRDSLRALLVLQSDIQRMLPIVNALNAGTTNFGGNFTNLFGVVVTSP